MRTRRRVESILYFTSCLVIVLQSTSCLAVGGQADRSYVIENRFLSRSLSVISGRLHTTEIHNKLGDCRIAPTSCHEFTLRLSQGTDTIGTDRVLTARDFEIRNVCRHRTPAGGNRLSFVLVNREHQLTATVHYELDSDDFYLRKYLDVTSAKPVTLERIDVDVVGAEDAYQPYQIKAMYARGKWSPGLGQPLFTKKTGTFWGVEFPRGLQFRTGPDTSLRLRLGT